MTELPPEFLTTPSLVLNKEHPLSDLYYKKARYKVYWGGRGAAKSWGFAEALIRLTSVSALRVLCVREYQTSIKESSWKLLRDMILRLGMSAWFTVSNESIKSKAGSEFIFKGLHGNEKGIRSTEGVDLCWAEEADAISELSWRVLLPTIRKAASEIWISFNLVSEDDSTYQRFVAHERPNSIVHKINYDQNPYFSGVLREEMETDKANDYHLYEHIWLGMPQVIGDSVIFRGKYIVREFEDDLWRSAERLFFGADFGFSKDPDTLIRSFILDNHKWPEEQGRGKRRLFVEYEAWGVGVEIDEMEAFYDSVPGSHDWPIKSDAARPEFPSHFRRHGGYNMSPAEKWEGSVKDGIKHLRGFDQIVIHPRCPRTATEARLYSYKVDKTQLDDRGQPMVLPVIVDRHNHCWDAIRYSLDGYIMRSGEIGMWQRLGQHQIDEMIQQ